MRTSLRQVVFLLAGGAVSVAVLIIAMPLTAPLPEGSVVAVLLFVPIWLVLSAGIGLLPGVREIEVAGARDLLGVREDAVVTPAPMRRGHRWRTALWVLCHQLVGLVTGIALTAMMLLLLAVVLVVSRRREVVVGGLTVDLPTGWSGVGFVVGSLGAVALLIGLVGMGGRTAAWAAPVLLGPTGADRLAIAEARLARERAHVRLSRDLHDGVGHSLSAISLQAAAAERGLGPDEHPAREALHTIRALAAEAVGELEHVLSVLRDDVDGRARLEDHRDERDVTGLVRAHRDRGMVVRLTIDDDVPGLPSVVGRTVHRVAAEGLANAEKHAPGEPVDVGLRGSSAEAVVTVRNPTTGPAGGQPLGHGLTSLREQVDLVGGTLRAGPDPDGWVLEARLPTGVRRGR